MLANGVAVLREQDEHFRRPPVESKLSLFASAPAPRRVLILDASLTVRTIVTVSLRRAGYDSVSFSDGTRFFQWVQQEAQRRACVPCLLVLDLDLPDRDGYVVLPIWKSQ